MITLEVSWYELAVLTILAGSVNGEDLTDQVRKSLENSPNAYGFTPDQGKAVHELMVEKRPDAVYTKGKTLSIGGVLFNSLRDALKDNTEFTSSVIAKVV